KNHSGVRSGHDQEKLKKPTTQATHPADPAYGLTVSILIFVENRTGSTAEVGDGGSNYRYLGH
ncbi:hypothetical protein, partial [Arthrobacter sp. efr-133-TYG-104]|uniref:hypothetical protein n=1 Tax=Arthrobacter sp. efr-133-TYG-104 TaxID=3040324 RepID=UPI002551BD88